MVRSIGLVICAVLGFASCQKPSACTSLSGSATTTKELSLGSISELVINNGMSGTLHFDSTLQESKVLVTGAENWIEAVVVHDQGNRAEIENQLSCKWIDPKDAFMYLDIYVPRLAYLEFSSGGEFVSEGVNKIEDFKYEQWDCSGTMELNVECARSEYIFNTGPADLKVKGTTTHLNAFSNCEGKMDLANLIAQTAYISQNGLGTITVTVATLLQGEIHDQGDIVYYGNPELEVVAYSTGELLKGQ